MEKRKQWKFDAKIPQAYYLIKLVSSYPSDKSHGKIFTFPCDIDTCQPSKETKEVQRIEKFSYQAFIFVNFEHSAIDISRLQIQRGTMSFTIYFCLCVFCDNLITNCCSFAYNVFFFALLFAFNYFSCCFFSIKIPISTCFKTKKKVDVSIFISRSPSLASIHLKIVWATFDMFVWPAKKRIEWFEVIL